MKTKKNEVRILQDVESNSSNRDSITNAHHKIFKGLLHKYGPDRVIDIPIIEVVFIHLQCAIILLNSLHF
ncbi:hypothetical protein H5410_036071 [Solanum commersonii]|uniref:Uncharacterized protein n=1 Tax=Solanum commersonii TaxID=4109 RepID=A0A9J5Y4L4_SOLCO|nr:hypothetical protein H5410_036071 [Solanum commersonii]